MRTRIFSYNSGSEGAKALSAELAVKRIKHGPASLYRPRDSDTIINWGCGPDKFPFKGPTVLNPPDLVRQASNKLTFFRTVGDTARTPQWTDDRGVARQWYDAGHTVVARRVLAGHSAEGLVIFDKNVDFVDAPLYTMYVKKKDEYRVHIFKDQGVVDLQRKAKRPDFDGVPDWRVRNHQNGFIFVRNDVHAPEDVSRQAVQAFEAIGLDFGAVDVIWNEQEQKAYVLEINTAPGLVGQTVQSYGNAFRKALG